MSLNSDAIQVLEAWYASRALYQDHLPSKGAVSAVLHVLGRLKDKYDLSIDSHVSGSKAQVAGLSARTLQKELAEFGETRALTSVAGRSNRGAREDVADLLKGMVPLRLDRQPETARTDALQAMRRHIVTRYVPRYFEAKRVKATFDQASATSLFIEAILENARTNRKAGPVAEYLVGAKLALLYPNKEIRNKKCSSADVQGGFEGDFQVGNTVFHVTVAPMPELYDKLKRNLERGLRVYLIVPNSQLQGARQNASLVAGGRVEVAAIESFLATNLDEAAEFDGSKLRSGFRKLLETYNQRVQMVDPDRSLLIEIPPNV